MQFFADQLAEILTALANAPVPKRKAEKRSVFRFGALYRT